MAFQLVTCTRYYSPTTPGVPQLGPVGVPVDSTLISALEAETQAAGVTISVGSTSVPGLPNTMGGDDQYQVPLVGGAASNALGYAGGPNSGHSPSGGSGGGPATSTLGGAGGVAGGFTTPVATTTQTAVLSGGAGGTPAGGLYGAPGGGGGGGALGGAGGAGGAGQQGVVIVEWRSTQ